jgi:hypothetical protein
MFSEAELTRMAERGAEIALAKAGVVKPQISTNEAYRIYGRKRVTLWRKNGFCTPVKQGGIVYYRVQELEKASIKNLL